jgi:predicted lactoylglutathione lyase
MPTNIFLNLPVKNLDTSVKFFEALGYSFNKQFTDENATCLVISDNIYAMLLVEPFFKTFTTKEIADTATTTEALIALSVDSREEVDTLADKALAAGGSYAGDPQDQGFMYSRSFQDPDGHTWEILFMEPSHIQAS